MKGLIRAMLDALYTASLRGIRAAFPLLSHGDGKLARGVRGRRAAVDRLSRWAASGRNPLRPLVWFHAPSVGEGLQAGAVMEALRSARPDVQIVYTFFSPSAERLATRLGADVADYLPIDLPDEVGEALDALRPSALAFSRTEVWPNLTREATRRGIPVLLLSGTLPASSSRLRRPVRSFLAKAHGNLACLGAISAADSERFQGLGVPADRIVVMGDARFDQVARRARAVDRKGDLLAPLHDPSRLTVVAGSTWAEDEASLIAAWAELPGATEGYRVVLVPHEPTASHLRELEIRLSRAGMEHARLGELEAGRGTPAFLIVDRMGILGDLYALADVAYVGGGFGSAGLHSVLEPAAFAIPVLFGPNHTKSREAGELADAGGGFVVGDQVQLGGTLARLLTNRAAREAAGAAAGHYISAGLGAADRGARLILQAMEQTPSP